MKMRKMKVTALPAAALSAIVLLAGCSDSESAVPAEVATTSAAPTVTDEELGQALDKLVFHGTSERSQDNGLCFVQAVKNGGVTAEGQAHIVEAAGDGLAELTEGMWETNGHDASILASAEMRARLDTCVTAQDGGTKGSQTPEPSDGGGEISGETAYESPEPPQETSAAGEKEPNLEPKYPLREGQKINSSSELTDGLVSIFQSYALDEAQAQTYETAGKCLSDAVFKAGFSDDALRFLAEGPPVGTGSVSQFLPTEEDTALWESQDFKTALVDCTLNVSPEDAETPET
jgi:hypothetical protein